MESRSRWLTVGLALLSASAFALAVQSAWWNIAEVTIGPYGSRHCFGGECRDGGLSWLGNHDLFMRAAISTRAGGYIAMFALVIVAGAVAARRRPVLIARASIIAIMTATAAASVFIAKFPGGVGKTSLGAGPLMFGIGIVSGVAASILVLRSRR